MSVSAGLIIAILTLGRATADDLAKNQILQNKADEQEIGKHTAAVVVQIQGLIDELAANGISGSDTRVLMATKAALTNLSGPELDRVAASLQAAVNASNPEDGKQNALNAYAGEKGIILQFRQILKDYEERQAAYELPVRFKELTDRQTETMLSSVDFARATAGKSGSELMTLQQTTEQIVQADQEAIGNEVTLAGDQLNKAAQGSTGDNAATLQQAEADFTTGPLLASLSQADDDLKAGRVLKAINEQKTARDELRKITQDLNPPANEVDALSATVAELAKLIDEQKKLLDDTNAAIGMKPRVLGLDSRQGALVDEANTIQQDMQSLSPVKAGLVNEAITPMQSSRAALAIEWGGVESLHHAAGSQQEALDKLEEALNELEQQLADATKAQDAAKDPVAALQDLQNQIRSDMQQEKQVSAQTTQAMTATNPPDPTAVTQAQQAQSQVQQQTDTLQQSAQPVSLAASQALASAAAQMNQAQQDLTDPAKAPQAQAAQQAAQQALAQADQQVSQQIAQAQQQQADPAALAAAAGAIQQAQTSVSTALADASPSAHATAPRLAAANAALAAAAQDTTTAAGAKGLPGSATAAIQQAQAAIAQGEQQAAKGDAPGTANSAAAAEQALAQAQASVELAQAGMATPSGAGSPPEAPGPPGPPGPPGSQAATSIQGGSTAKGTLHDTTGNGKFVSVALRDRAAIDQTQAEKRPQEYAPMIDQYLKNLADQSSAAP
jgi:hypothetical protein